MNLKETIRKILREETEIPLFLRRRFTKEDLDWIVNDVKELIEFGESIDTAVYDGVREFIKSKKFKDIDEFGDEQDYWDSYLRYEKPMVKYVKSVLGIDNREINLQEHTKKELMEVNDRAKKLIRKYVNEMGLNETSKMMGFSKTKIVEITNIPIDSDVANDLLLENMRLKNLKREYKEFDIRPSGDGIFYWGASTNTGHFLPDMIESIAIVATPFWDGEEWTPVELDWYTLLDGDGKAIIEVSSDGSYYRQLKHQTHFNSVKELFNWYEEYYLPTVYDVMMNEILPNVHQQVDDELDNRGGYK